MENVWILVADSARARILSASDPRVVSELADYAHPQSRQHDRDLTSDQPGRSFDSSGQGRHAMEPEQSAHEHEADAFAAELAQALDEGRAAHRFQRLVLIAPPAFLGRVRHHLPKATAQTIATQIDKNLVQSSPDEVLSYVTERIEF